MATTLTKLALKFIDLERNEAKQNRLCASIMLTLSSILHLGRSGFPTKPITNDDADRIFICLKTLSERSPEIIDIFKLLCRDALAKMLDAHQAEEQQTQKDKQKKTAKIQPDDPITFGQLSTGKENLLGENVFESSLNQALAGTKSKLTAILPTQNSLKTYLLSRHFAFGCCFTKQQIEQGYPVDGLLRSGLRRGLRSRQSIRHRS